jgi:hypothetical protein
LAHKLTSRKLRKSKISWPTPRGQSLVELALVLTGLIVILVGIVEYGFLLNRYLNLVDATRETARLGAVIDPFVYDDDGVQVLDAFGKPQLDANFFVRPYIGCEPADEDCPFGDNPPGLADFVEDFMEPVRLDEDRDDVVISFFSVDEDGDLVRFPEGDATGWSYFDNEESKFSNTQIRDRINQSPGAPPSGILLIEIFYTYDQQLNLPLFNLGEGGIPVYSYAIMPLSAAEPTPEP